MDIVEAFDFESELIDENDYFGSVSRDDVDLNNYNIEANKSYNSPIFYYYHGIASTPLCGVKFHYVFTPAKNAKLVDPHMQTYTYLKKVSTDFEFIRCLAGQHLKGTWKCAEGKVDGNGNATMSSEMTVKYGDNGLFKKVVVLRSVFEGNRFVYLNELKYKE